MERQNENKSGYKNTELGLIPVEWRIESLEQIVDKQTKISYGIVQTGKPVKDGIRCIRVVDIKNKKIAHEGLITTSKKISDSYKKTIVRKGDLVIALRGKIGGLALIDEQIVGANLTRGVALISVSKMNHNEFVLQQLSSQKSKSIFEKQLNGSALQELSIGILRKIPIILPPLPEQ
jgi:type I restriction enzyme S subunit